MLFNNYGPELIVIFSKSMASQIIFKWFFDFLFYGHPNCSNSASMSEWCLFLRRWKLCSTRILPSSSWVASFLRESANWNRIMRPFSASPVSSSNNWLISSDSRFSSAAANMSSEIELRRISRCGTFCWYQNLAKFVTLSEKMTSYYPAMTS